MTVDQEPDAEYIQRLCAEKLELQRENEFLRAQIDQFAARYEHILLDGDRAHLSAEIRALIGDGDQ